MREPVMGAILTAFSIVLAGSAGPAQAAPAARSDVIAAVYNGFAVAPPSTSKVTICHGFGCKILAEVALGPVDHARLAGLMAQGRKSAEAERRAVAAAAAWFDKRVASTAATQNHVSRAGMAYTFKSEGQFDCIDTSRNMTTLLLLLDQDKLLHFHVPDEPTSRGHLIDGRPPHATAVLTEKASGAGWTVDSWTRDYGQPAEIMPLAQWEARYS
jgi:hypothetical protein